MKIKAVKKQKVRTVGVKFKSKVNGGREEIVGRGMYLFHSSYAARKS